jgi:hypothetical protein
MKKSLALGVTSLVLLILSASAFYFWQQKQKNVPATDTAGKVAPASRETAKHVSTSAAGASHDDSPPRAAVRPASVPEREEQLAARKKMIELIQEDIRGERTALEELRSQIKSELQALNEAVGGAEEQRGNLDGGGKLCR